MIVGAGFAGLLSAHVFPRHELVDVRSEPSQTHHALMRFRSTAVSDLVGVPFRAVQVHKGIWWNGHFVAPDIQVANVYSRKVVGGLYDRSIWNIAPVVRYVAPETLYEQLLESVGHRITWATEAWPMASAEPVINTAPLPTALAGAGVETDLEFRHQPIAVERFRLFNSDVFQTIYFPSPVHTMYRASITGDLLTCEFVREPSGPWRMSLDHAFGFRGEMARLQSRDQRYGKIAPVEEKARRALIAQLSRQHNLFSVGRFATWRNILLDDVVHDLAVVKQLSTAAEYERRLASL